MQLLFYLYLTVNFLCYRIPPPVFSHLLALSAGKCVRLSSLLFTFPHGLNPVQVCSSDLSPPSKEKKEKLLNPAGGR